MNSRTTTSEATAIILNVAASHEDFGLEQGDVDSAFLYRRYLRADRSVLFRPPCGGLPSTSS